MAILLAVRRSPEIEAIARRIITSRLDTESDVMAGLLSGADELRFIGSAHDEWVQGKDIVHILKATSQVVPLDDVDILRLEAFEDGKTGWAAWEEMQTRQDGHILTFRCTIVLVLESGVWKIVQSHRSVAAPMPESEEIAITHTLAELLASIGGEGDSLKSISGTATFLFTDIVDSTALSLQLGETAWHEAITDHLAAVASVVESEGGTVVKTLGDGGMFVFESGSAALRAAGKIQERVASSAKPKMSVRMGLHTGDVFQTDDDYVGITVAKAARVAAAARGGQILVSNTTAGLVSSSDFEFGEPFTVELKGLDGKHQLQSLHWP